MGVKSQLLAKTKVLGVVDIFVVALVSFQSD
jgi:hypothetical protein